MEARIGKANRLVPHPFDDAEFLAALEVAVYLYAHLQYQFLVSASVLPH